MNHRNSQLPGTARIVAFFVLGLFAALLNASAQETIAVAPTKMNLLVIGIDNPVSVAVSGAPDNKVAVSVSGGGSTVSKIGAGLYNVRVTTITDNCLLNVYVDGTLAGTSRFRVRLLPAPAGAIGGYSSGATIAADVFRTQPGVAMYSRDFPVEVKYEVVSFTLKLVGEDGKVRSVDCQGSAFSPLAKQYLDQYATAGQIVTIDNLRVREAGGKELKLPGLLYYIK